MNYIMYNIPEETEEYYTVTDAGREYLEKNSSSFVTSETGGIKESKQCRIGDIAPEALWEVGEAAGYGYGKYNQYNYLKGFDWSLAYNAAQRHLMQFWSGEDLDSESGLSHLAHAAWQCLAMLAFYQREIGTDDRPVASYIQSLIDEG